MKTVNEDDALGNSETPNFAERTFYIIALYGFRAAGIICIALLAAALYFEPMAQGFIIASGAVATGAGMLRALFGHEFRLPGIGMALTGFLLTVYAYSMT